MVEFKELMEMTPEEIEYYKIQGDRDEILKEFFKLRTIDEEINLMYSAKNTMLARSKKRDMESFKSADDYRYYLICMHNTACDIEKK